MSFRTQSRIMAVTAPADEFSGVPTAVHELDGNVSATAYYSNSLHLEPLVVGYFTDTLAPS